MQVVDRNGRLKVEITSTVDDISIGVTTISGGTNGRVLYDNAGVVGEIAGTVSEYIAGDGSLQTFPTSFPANKMVTVGRNATGSTLYKGTIVYILGSTGNRPNFVKAQANTEATSAGTFGVIESDISNNSDGNCVTIGTIDNLDTRSTATHPFTTDTLADGDTIYLSPTTAGYVTNVKPYAPSHLVYVGKVVRTSPTNGTIVYRIQNGYELDELHDVAAQTPSNNDALAFETSTQLWKPKSLTTLLGFTPVPTSRTLTINGTTQDLSADRTFTISTGITIGTTAITSGTVGRVLFEGTGNVVSESANLFWDNTNGRLGIGTSSPDYKQTIIDTSTLFTQRLSNTATTGRAGIFMQNNATAYAGFGTYGTAFTVGALQNNTTFFASHDVYFSAGDVSNAGIIYFTNGASRSNERMRIASTGNVLINTTTDAGFKVDINGTARVRGAGSTNATIAFSVINSSSAELLTINDSNLATFAGGNGRIFTNVIRLNYINSANDNFSIMQANGSTGNAKFYQGVSVGTSSDPVASAILEAVSTTKGFLPPRMTTAQKNAIASPATGLMVFDLTLGLISVYNGTIWISL